MGNRIQQITFQEGEIFCKWMHSRLIRNNKNVLSAELGPTGSGKSYRDLRKVELWYQYYFKEKFPIENICFGIASAMKLISSGKLRKGEVIIFEEAGVNLGSLDFQTKVSKMMNYILQSFRSLNIAIFFNLPYLSMLSSQARLLMHFSSESVGIDQEKKMNICKPLFHQVNQDKGKIYKKFPIVKCNGVTRKIKRFSYSMPSQYLVDAYEAKKNKYLTDLTTEYTLELEKQESDKLKRLGRKDITPTQREVIVLLQQGLNLAEIARKTNKTIQAVSFIVKTLEKNGYRIRDNQKEPLPLKVNVDS